jgi:hypothetical protein
MHIKEKNVIDQTTKQILELAESENKPTERSAIDALKLITSMLTQINDMKKKSAEDVKKTLT